jgi:glucosyl-dolichyl phosphate glucuronosyltransferase
MKAVELEPTMHLDVIIPTYNRADLLPRTLESLLTATVPDGLTVIITVVDNNSKDSTRQVVDEWSSRHPGRVSYLCETRQGRSCAINAGVRATHGDLVGFIDDDEEIDVAWYSEVYSAFKTGQVDFLGGPCLPRWGAEVPAWFPDDYRGVIGWVECGDRMAAFDDDFPAMLMGGNAVLTRAVLDKVGLYSEQLGRTDRALLSCEDEDLYRRLRAVGALGYYQPRMIIYHYVPRERLLRSYFRRWCFWRGVSKGVMDREYREPVAYLAGVPRFLFGRMLQGLLRRVKGLLAWDRDPAQRFADELTVWDLVGFIHGKHFYSPD